MNPIKPLLLATLICFSIISQAQNKKAYNPDFKKPAKIKGMTLQWNDEFNVDGKPDANNWNYENGLVRNEELQWYQADNANCLNGLLVIEGRKQQIPNPRYKPESTDWKAKREHSLYTSASINTRRLHEWKFGRFEIRARIDTSTGSWPAIWSLGTVGPWPANGEVDLMEFYRVAGEPTILANIAWGGKQRNIATWDSEKIPLSKFTSADPEWVKKFHVWRMDWSKESINLYIDDVLVNSTMFDQTINADGSNPFLNSQYLLLNLALGSNGADPATAKFPIKYEVDYVRVYQ